MKNKILVVVAHPDDEVLGMGGVILKLTKNNEVSLLILSNGEGSRESEPKEKERLEQARKVAKELGVKNIFFEDLPDNQFDSMVLLSVVKKVEKVVEEIKPEIIYTHHSNDLNIDHRTTFQAVLTACRPQPNFFVRKILTFETLSSTEWQQKNPENMFYPNEYVDITNTIDKKIEILRIYKNELANFPHPRSEKGVRILSEYRGMEVGYKNAEAFQVIRNLID
jgi:LmbE family N-acetylglucosaminyl deacetylase